MFVWVEYCKGLVVRYRSTVRDSNNAPLYGGYYNRVNYLKVLVVFILGSRQGL